ncbi:MAG: hypothetical protein JXB47_05895 [Anaerolineae bacterium]|nr:hypothetical protein [Anaerolineae bacterium]
MSTDINIHFTGEDWARIERDWCAWWAHALERPLIMIGEKVKNTPFVDFVPNLPPDISDDAVIDHYQAHLEARRYYGDAFPKWWVNFGPGIMAGFIGANVHAAPPPDETVWFSPAEALTIADVRPAYDPDNVWWQRVRALTQRAVERWGDNVVVSHTDLGGNLDIAASLRETQRLLYELYDAPDEVERLVKEITRLWLRYYDELYAITKVTGRGTSPWAAIWSPGKCYMLQSDFSYMISPEMYERFVMPDLVACCDFLDHAMYHLDGKGQIPHLDMLLSIERLGGIQWIPGDGNPPPHEWLPLLKRILDAGKLCQLYVSAEGARTIVRELGGKGFALYISEEMSKEDAEDFIKLLAREDARA